MFIAAVASLQREGSDMGRGRKDRASAGISSQTLDRGRVNQGRRGMGKEWVKW